MANFGPAIRFSASFGTTLRKDLPIWVIAGMTALLHLAVSGRYDAFRNELYFIVCGRHPDFGYVDQPPLVPLLAAATQLLGESTWLLRLPGVVAATALVPLTATFARLLGAGRVSVVLAAAAAALAPGLAALTSTLTTSTFEPLAWTATAYLASRALLRDERKSLVSAGLVIGISMEAKYGIGIWLIGLSAGVLLTGARRLVAWPHCWVGAVLAVALATPSLAWQTLHGWPFFTVISSPMTTGAGYLGSPIRFEVGQIISINALLAPLWIAGVIGPFTSERLQSVRFLAVAFLIATVIDFAADGKNYYLFPVYPTMFALGAAALAGIGWRLATPWLASAFLVFGVMAPVVLPILDPPMLDSYLSRTHLRPPPIEAAGVGAPLTQVFSDELGWRSLEKQVAAVYQSLPADERQRVAIFASNYGEAAAIDVYGPADSLPSALSGNNQYFLWGPREFDGSIIIHINGDPERWRQFCGSVELVGRFDAPYVMPYERSRDIFVCRDLRGGLAGAWPRFKRFR